MSTALDPYILARAVGRQLILRSLGTRLRVHAETPLELLHQIFAILDKHLFDHGLPLMQDRLDVTKQTQLRWLSGERPIPWTSLIRVVKEVESQVPSCSGASAIVMALEVGAQIGVLIRKQIPSRFLSKRSENKTWVQGWGATYPAPEKRCFDGWRPVPREFDLAINREILCGTKVPNAEVNPDGDIWLTIKNQDFVCSIWHNCSFEGVHIPVLVALRRFKPFFETIAQICPGGPLTLDDIAMRFFATQEAPLIEPYYHRLQWWLAVSYGSKISDQFHLTDHGMLPKMFSYKTAAMDWYLKERGKRPVPPPRCEVMYGMLPLAL